MLDLCKENSRCNTWMLPLMVSPKNMIEGFLLLSFFAVLALPAAVTAVIASRALERSQKAECVCCRHTTEHGRVSHASDHCGHRADSAGKRSHAGIGGRDNSVNRQLTGVATLEMQKTFIRMRLFSIILRQIYIYIYFIFPNCKPLSCMQNDNGFKVNSETAKVRKDQT